MTTSHETMTRRSALGALLKGASLGVSVPYLLTACELSSPVEVASRRGVLERAPWIEALTFRRSSERGGADHGWLQAKHTFSFAGYRDPSHTSFRSLRVMNEDIIQGGGGFPMHPHRDMEILTYVLDGALEHRDSLGHGGVIRPGEVQAMSAGTGIRHSEFNPSGLDPVHLIQIWIEPDRANHAPRYAQKRVRAATRSSPIRLIASPDGAEGSVALHQDARLHAVTLKPGQVAFYEAFLERHTWVQVASGDVTLNRAHAMHQGDGVSTSRPGGLELGAGGRGAELLIFDLA